MRHHRPTTAVRRRLRLLAATTGAASVAALAPVAAHADAFSSTIPYACQFGGSDYDQVATLSVNTDFPDASTGTPTAPAPVQIGLSLPLAPGGTAAGTGTVTLGLTITSLSGATKPVTLTGNVEIKAKSPDVSPKGFGFGTTLTFPATTFTEPGATYVSVNSLAYTVDGPNTIAHPGSIGCQLSSSGTESQAIAGFLVEDSNAIPDPPSYDLAGSIALKGVAQGKLPIKGALVAPTVNRGTGSFTAGLTFQPSTANLRAWGFLPVRATIVPIPTSLSTGTFLAGTLSTSVGLLLSPQKVSILGITIADDYRCTTQNTSTVALSSTSGGFEELTGGTLNGNFAISPLKNCGQHTGLVSALFSGAGNTITLKATPAEASPQTT